MTQPPASVCALLLLASCASATEALELDVACASATAIESTELTVLARVQQGGEPPTEEVRIAVTVGEQSYALSVPAGTGHSVATFQSSVPVGTSLHVTAKAAGSYARARCVVASGLPDSAPAARKTEEGATVSWREVEGAAVYRLTALDFPTNTVVATATVTRSPRTLEFEARSDQLIVIDFVAEALPGIEEELPPELPAPRRLHRRVLLTAGSDGGSAAGWQLFGPGDFVDGALQIRYPALASGEHVAVLLSNAGGVDLGSSTAPAAVVEVDGATLPGTEKHGTTASSPLPPHVLSDLPDLEHPSRAPALSALMVQQPPTAAPQKGDRRGLCVIDRSQLPSVGSKRIAATVQHRSTHAAFWVEDDAQAALDSLLGGDGQSFWHELEDAYEAHVLPAVRAHFGAESDVNGDGVMSFLFTDLGPVTDQGLVGGWFDARDVSYPADTTPDCDSWDGNRGANGFDLLYLRDPASFCELGGPAVTLPSLAAEGYPNLMAHELQHNVNFTRRHLDPQRPVDATDEQPWLNEGLSQLAEDVAGYGLNLSGERVRAAAYLATHGRFSLTTWEGSYGSYGGSHVLLRYLTDRFGPALIQRLEDPRSAGTTNLGAATGVPFDLLLAEFATASVFSNEPYSPGTIFDYHGASWTPWHTMVGPAAYTLVTPAAPGVVDVLRADGWHALATSAGRGEPASITVRTTATRPFYVVAVRFNGTLP